MNDVLRISRALASIDDTINTINDLYETVSEIADRNARLREALKPFAEMQLWTDAYPDGPLEATTKERFVDPHWVIAARAAMGESDEN